MNVIEAVRNNQLNQFRDALINTPLAALSSEVDRSNGYNFIHYIIQNKQFEFFKVLQTHLARTPAIFHWLLAHQDNWGRTVLHLAVQELIKLHKRKENVQELATLIQWILEHSPQLASIRCKFHKTIFDLLKAEREDATLRNYLAHWENLVNQPRRSTYSRESDINWSHELFNFLQRHTCTHEHFKEYINEAKNQNQNRIENIKNDAGDNLWIYGIKNNKLDLISWLLQNAPQGAYESDATRNNILHLCVIHQCLDILTYLVQEKAFHAIFSCLINQFNDKGETPIYLAAVSINNSEILKSYIRLFTSVTSNQQQICNLNLVKNLQQSLFTCVIEKHDAALLVLLMDKGLQLDHKDSKMVIRIISDYFNVLQNREPALSNAELNNFTNILLNYRVCLLAKLLHDMIKNDPMQLSSYVDDLQKQLSLGEFRQALNYHINDLSSLQFAIKNKQLENAKRLIECGADYKKLISREGQETAQDMARKYFGPENVRILDDLADKFIKRQPFPSVIKKGNIAVKLPKSIVEVPAPTQTKDEVRPSTHAHKQVDKKIEKELLKALQAERQKKLKQQQKFSDYTNYLSLLIIDGVINGLPATNISRRVPGLSHQVKFNIKNLSDSMKMLSESIKSSLENVWREQPNQLEKIEAIVIAKLCEIILRHQPSIISYKQGVIKVNLLNGYSFDSELKALQEKYTNCGPEKLYSINERDNFDEELLVEITDGIIQEIFPSGIKHHLNKEDESALRGFLKIRFSASQVRSTLFAKEMLVEDGKYYIEFHQRLIKEIAFCLKEYKEIEIPRVCSPDSKYNFAKAKPTNQAKLFDNEKIGWRLHAKYRENHYYALYDNEELIRKINEVINKVEHEMFVKGNPETVFLKHCNDIELCLNHAIIAKQTAICLCNQAVRDDKTIQEMFILNEEAMLHSRRSYDETIKFNHYKVFHMLVRFIDEIKALVKQVFENSKLPKTYYSQLLNHARMVLDKNPLLGNVLNNVTVSINEVILFELLAKHFNQGKRINYDRSTAAVAIKNVADHDLGPVHKGYSFLHANGHIGPDIQKWFLDLKNDFEEYYGIQLNQDTLIASYPLVNLQYAHFGQFVRQTANSSPNQSKHITPSSSPNGSSYSNNSSGSAHSSPSSSASSSPRYSQSFGSFFSRNRSNTFDSNFASGMDDSASSDYRSAWKPAATPHARQPQDSRSSTSSARSAANDSASQSARQRFQGN